MTKVVREEANLWAAAKQTLEGPGLYRDQDGFRRRQI